MLSFLSGIHNGLQQAKALKRQGRMLRLEGISAANSANRKADASMRVAGANWDIASEQRKTVRKNQTAAQGAARNRQGASGFTSEGAGSTLENVTRESYDDVIANMARSASIEYTNMFNSALATRLQGKMQQEALNAEARQYEIAAKATKVSTFLSAISGAAGAMMGFEAGHAEAAEYNETNADAIAEGKLKALDPDAMGFATASSYASEFANSTMSFNPFTVGMTRKQNWRSFAAIAEGSTPGWQQSEFSL